MEYAGVLDWRISEVMARDLPVKATVKEKYHRPGQVGYRLEVMLAANAPAGTLKQDLFLKTNDPASPLVPVLVEANVQTSLSVTPSSLKVTGVKVGEPLEQRVAIRTTRPFTVTAVDGLGNGVALGNELNAGPASYTS